jgi:GAF domain-containing protein
VARDALVVLVERRRQRVLTGEDRNLLQALIRQAEAALRRVASERQAAALARFVN